MSRLRPARRAWLVEGHYTDPEDGSMTGDYILAADGDAAKTEAEAARASNCNGWIFDRSIRLEDYASELRATLRDLEAMTHADIERGWAETKAYLTGDEDPDALECDSCGSPLNEDGECLTCEYDEETGAKRP